ncbi:MauE/DoxX family redox-associated membrane protein [Desulfosarcina cetonica]|uniref:MauE/DoxX family redox-associated membrane protein n=1 Tax=Desulfosarcina cetonica TaxID=90730 RepID=UPI00155DC55F|nr:MauE/DoxX family redox-associated membrane protein [Desulfosarcina cetonica]
MPMPPPDTPIRWFTGLYHLLRWVLGGVFIYSGASKLLAPRVFAVLIEAYGLVPDAMLMPLAVILPTLEVLAGLALLVDLRGALGTITGLLVLFVAILAYGIRMGLDVDCGCFGPEDIEARAYHGLRPALYRDLLMLVGVGFMYAWRRYRHIDPLTGSSWLKKHLNKKTEDAYVEMDAEVDPGERSGGGSGRSGDGLHGQQVREGA